MSEDKTFVWNDDLIREYGEWYKKTQGNPKELWGKDLFETFKQVKINCQKEVKKDYEIRSFLNTSQNILFKKTDSGIFESIPTNYGYTEDVFLALSHMAIQSVKRLSDNATFWVGEIEGKWGKILKFKIENGGMLVYFEYRCASAWIELNKLVKLEPKQKPLLTTEEGIMVYNPLQKIYLAGIGDINLSYHACNAASCSNNPKIKYFHSEINRDQWVKDNTSKMVTLKELLSLFNEEEIYPFGTFKNRITEFFK